MNHAEDFSTANRMDRRTAIKWMLTAAASTALLNIEAPGATDVTAKGYGQDPDLLKDYKPGDLWPLTLTPDQRRTAAALCDVIIPAEPPHPAASKVAVHDFIDEWISAPYPGHEADRKVILNGLAWLDEESQQRHQKNFVGLANEQKNSLCESVCLVEKAETRLKSAAEFFRRYRDLTAGGYYTTREGMEDIGYRGNTPLLTFEGPSPETLARLGL